MSRVSFLFVLFLETASCNGVAPNLLVELTSAPFSRSSLTMGSLAYMTAQCKYELSSGKRLNDFFSVGLLELTSKPDAKNWRTLWTLA